MFGVLRWSLILGFSFLLVKRGYWFLFKFEGRGFRLRLCLEKVVVVLG